MNILQVHTAYREQGGEDVVVATEAEMLRAAGHTVSQRIAANPTQALPTIGALLQAPWRPRAARAVRAVIAERRPDLAMVHNTWFALSPSVVAALGDAGVPVVMTLHNYRLVCPAGTLFHHGRICTDCVGDTPWHAVRHRCYRNSAALSAVAAATVEAWGRSDAMDAVSRFVVMTESGRELFLRAGLPAGRIVVRPHGLVDPGSPSAAPSRSSTITFVGRAVAEKGLDALLRWWGTQPRRWTLDVIGEGPVVDDWRGREPAGVRLRGAMPREHVLAAMRTSRAVVVPSLWPEPFGLVAVEAMACGVPVVSTGVGGLADIHGTEGGWVAGVTPDGLLDHDAWDGALARLGEDAAVDAAGAAARARYVDRFTRQQAARSLEALLDEVLRRP